MSVVAWMTIQSFLSINGFYETITSIPPRPILLLAPPLLFITGLFVTNRGRKFIDTFDASWLTWLHTVRIPVEMVLLSLSIYKLVPVIMTFEGRNFDIISGITAPFIAYFGYRKKTLGRGFLIAWNILCLGLLINIVLNALFAIPGAMQLQSFDVPNIGVLRFPFVFLPCFIVPAVLLSHLVCLRKLRKNDLQ